MTNNTLYITFYKMMQDTENISHYIADNGKVFKRISDGLIYGEEIYLGYTYYINGIKLDEPHLEVIDEFEEIDIPSEKSEDTSTIDIEHEKNFIINKINEYDISDNVNGFYLNGNVMWLDKATRVGLMNSTTIEKNSGRETTTLWYNNVGYTLSCDLMIQMLSALELYALECYNVTAQHIANVLSLEDIDLVKIYDYTSNYPEKLSFTV